MLTRRCALLLLLLLLLVRHVAQVKQHSQWDERSYSLRLFHAPRLTGEWTEHPMSPISADLRYARGGGRPFVHDGHVYRWAQVRAGCGRAGV